MDSAHTELGAQQHDQHVETNEVLSVPEAALFLGISERTLWTLTNRKLIPCFHCGRRVLYLRSKLLEYGREGGAT